MTINLDGSSRILPSGCEGEHDVLAEDPDVIRSARRIYDHLQPIKARVTLAASVA